MNSVSRNIPAAGRKRIRVPLKIITAAVFICLAAALSAGGNKEKSAKVQVSGRVRLVGTGTFPELVITGPDREWYIEKDEEYKLKNYQQRTVTVEGYETVTALTFANGLPAGERRTLRNIKLIALE